MAVRDFSNATGSGRLKPYHWMLDQKRLKTSVYTDVVFGRCKSLRGNTCASVFATAFHYVRVKAMVTEKDAHMSLDEFFDKVGVPSKMISDQEID